MFFSVDHLKNYHKIPVEDSHVLSHLKSKVKFQQEQAVVNSKQLFMLTMITNEKHVGG